MPKFFYYRERIFMKVRPVNALMRSRTISSVLVNQDFFAVDMHSGALTVIRRGADELHPLDKTYMPIEDPYRPGYMLNPGTHTSGDSW